MKILLILFLFMGSVSANSGKYQSDFALVNKSYKGDVNRSVNLAKSIERFFQGKEKFYVTFPKSDAPIFKEKFDQAIKDGGLKKRPVFLYDEDIIRQCGVNVKKAMEMPGSQEQQVIKMCFSKTGLAKDYVTFDSDVYFVKNFDKSIFYDPETKILRTVRMYNLDKDHQVVSQIQKISDKMNVDIDNTVLYINGYGIWSSEILKKLEMHMKARGLYDFYDIIKYEALEMQWYGMFVQGVIPQEFYGMPSQYAMLTTLDKVNREGSIKLWNDFKNHRRLKRVLKSIRTNKPYMIIWNSEQCKKRNCDFLTLEEYASTKGVDIIYD